MRLVLVFSRWMSLGRWDELGMFERETALYRRLSAMGVQVSFLTWGAGAELDFAARLPGISILCNRFNLPTKHYERLAPLLHARHLWQADAIKTNQASAATIAQPAAKLWRRPLIARMGFMASEFAARDFGDGSPEYRTEIMREDTLFSAARAIVVTTPTMADNVANRHPDAQNRIRVIPNYVDTELFAPLPSVEKLYDVVFIGRLTAQKNIPVLLEALEISGSRALIVGSGPLENLVISASTNSQGMISWLPSLPNEQLPRAIAEADMFVLPSLWEGHPKTLIEAMSAGAAVIGADSPGINGVIKPETTGLLCPANASGLAQAISRLKTQPLLRKELGERARQFACESWSLERILQLELALIKEFAGTSP
ncbi:MAG: glycosyltransferase family 4 protein [Alphaproteobacteria bacterium]|nr:glycosyltransferase family 4 protein [Alphaproteobacteria bacterium]